MHLELRKVAAVGVLILLFLGPSFGNLFHVHETSHLQLCMHKGAVHFHALDEHSMDCFLCSFSFPTLQESKEKDVNTSISINWNRSTALYLENTPFLFLPPQHPPRAPPALYWS